MKNIFYKFFMIIAFSIITSNSHAQSDMAAPVIGHQGASNTGYYVGWDVNTTFDLNIQHLATGANAKNINFVTNATQKMTILGNNTATDGYVGIGIAAPNFMLHQNGGTSTATYHQFTNSAITGNTSADGLLIGIAYDGLAEFRQQEALPMIFYSRSTTSATMRERMRIYDGLGGDRIGGWANVAGVTKVSISHDGNGTFPLPQPVAMLNIGAAAPNNPAAQAGNRTWMDVGTYYNYDTDNMYVGIKDEGANHKDAVINWGDDITADPDQDFENLKFIFTGYSLSAGSSDPYNYNSTNGLEIARMNAHGNMGIGATFTDVITPKRRLDIFDDGSNHNPIGTAGANVYLGGPQLRLSQTLSSTAAGGNWTDFQTTSTGDLYIHPSASSVNRFVGINDPSPANTVEITSTSGVSPELAGLRFTNLTNGVSPITNPDAQKGVLSVDADGDVIFVVDEDNGGTGTGDVTACTVGGGTAANYITKWTSTAKEICKTEGIFESSATPYNVAIGGTTSPAWKLVVAGDIGTYTITDEYRLSSYKILGIGVNATSTLLGIDAGGLDQIGVGNTMPTADYNTILGYRAGYQLSCTACTTAEKNTLVGYYAGHELANTAADGGAGSNTFVGGGAGQYVQDGENNTAVGLHAGGGNTAGMTLGIGSSNSSFGYDASARNTDGNENSSLGFNALYSTTTGDNNVGIGWEAGSANVSGRGNTFVGSNANPSSNNLTNASAFGAGAAVGTSNCLVLGSSGVSVGIGTTTPSSLYLLDVQGGTGTVARFSGNILCNATTYPSDAMLKTNVTDLMNAKTILNQLMPHQYLYNTATYPQMNLPQGNQYGLLAQELEQVAPELVGNAISPQVMDSLGVVIHSSFPFKTVNYVSLIPVLIQAFKEQNLSMDSIRLAILQMQAQLDACCGGARLVNPNGEEQLSSINVDLKNAKSIILNQNVPNPFAEQTSISYFITDDVKKAQIFFYDQKGLVLKIVDISEKGAGQINVYAADLSSGSYNYSLIADGKLIETKKMVKTN
jgi:hypothetical protein